jgi:hypothetical protein
MLLETLDLAVMKKNNDLAEDTLVLDLSVFRR